MITRIVKMQFRPSETEAFLSLFERVKQQIRSFEGCVGLTLLRDMNAPDTLFTYSHWESEAHLNAYRNSELFEKTWKDTKSGFSAKAEAWSVLEQSHTQDNI
jgi:heme oxygenase (mycobilin-producing)